VSFSRQTIRRALVMLRSVIHGLRELLNFGLSCSMITLVAIATMHSVTDRWTDDMMMPITGHTV